MVLPVLLSTVHGISHLRVFLPKDLRALPARETAWKSVLECQKRFPDGIAMLDPVLHMGIKDDKFKTLVKVTHTILRSPSSSHMTEYARKFKP